MLKKHIKSLYAYISTPHSHLQTLIKDSSATVFKKNKHQIKIKAQFDIIFLQIQVQNNEINQKISIQQTNSILGQKQPNRKKYLEKMRTQKVHKLQKQQAKKSLISINSITFDRRRCTNPNNPKNRPRNNKNKIFSQRFCIKS